MFDNYYAASTPCSPSRGCIMTGRYATSNGLIGLVNRGWDLPDDQLTIVDSFNDAGYSTHLFGLQHERSAAARMRYGHLHPGSGWVGDVADALVEFLGSGEANRPCYINAGTIEVHLPFDRPEYTFDRSPDDVHVPPWLPDCRDVRREIARFHACIKYMDEQFGRILDALDDTPMKDDTVVVFTTDHGAAFPRAKSTLYDPGIGTALMIRSPSDDVSPGRYEQLLSNIDLAPTLLDIAGIDIPNTMEGRSFYPLVSGGDYEPRSELFSEKNFHDHYDPMRCIRTGRYKYIRSFSQIENLPLPADIEKSIASNTLRPDAKKPRPVEELYDLADDPFEETNLAEDAAHALVAEGLRNRLEDWMRSVGDDVREGMPEPPAEQFD